ncbi:MAG: OmpP1/FadL family transporter [Pseudomonadota bacterium]
MTFALKRSVLATAVAALVAAPAYATNGMNLEAFGAKAGGMGGASFAYDNGNSALMNNPATLSLRKEGNNFGLGLTVLNPNVDARYDAYGMEASSGGDSYLMPSVSFIKKSGQFTYGAGILAQGGMGTEWGKSSFLSMDLATGTATGLEQRSEVGFARLMFPLAYQVNDDLAVAAQLDYVRATMDLKMIDPMNMVHVDASDNNDFNGRMTGDGWAFKLGAHYKVSKEFAIGATYHSETDISDLEGSATLTVMPGSPMSAMMPAGAYPAKMRIVDFQWPETYGVGVAWNVTDKFMLAADVKRIKWSKSMKNFTTTMNVMDMGWQPEQSMPQNWDDQTVFMIGGQYMIAPNVALRAGFNYADNPVPDDTMNPLFPATIKSHYTLGVGWNIGGGHSVAASLAYAPEVEQTGTGMLNNGLTTTHSQTTWRINYNYNF